MIPLRVSLVLPRLQPVGKLINARKKAIRTELELCVLTFEDRWCTKAGCIKQLMHAKFRQVLLQGRHPHLSILNARKIAAFEHHSSF